jgi:hypothetical protein
MGPESRNPTKILVVQKMHSRRWDPVRRTLVVAEALSKAASAFAALLAKGAAVTSEAEQYRRLARELHFMARNLPPGEERSAFLKMAEEWDRLADQQEHQVGSTGIGDPHVRRSPRRPVS